MITLALCSFAAGCAVASLAWYLLTPDAEAVPSNLTLDQRWGDACEQALRLRQQIAERDRVRGNVPTLGIGYGDTSQVVDGVITMPDGATWYHESTTTIPIHDKRRRDSRGRFARWRQFDNREKRRGRK